jgi:hypothetical protein
MISSSLMESLVSIHSRSILLCERQSSVEGLFFLLEKIDLECRN